MNLSFSLTLLLPTNHTADAVRFAPALEIENTSADTEVFSMAPRTGLEPVTSKLTASCSTIELPGNMYILYYIYLAEDFKSKI